MSGFFGPQHLTQQQHSCTCNVPPLLPSSINRAEVKQHVCSKKLAVVQPNHVAYAGVADNIAERANSYDHPTQDLNY
jgi:hypothetical protein